MALSPTFIERHITQWENKLNKPFYPYRAKWPSRLFHHAPLDNAVKIIRDGNLRSRLDSRNTRSKDVAAPGVIDARVHAHNYARLYFRPRTPTQWHIEGIRKSGECQYGNEAHAPMLIMMVFDAREVLSQPGIQFCDRNMQLGTAEIWDTETQFLEIPFDKVYHEGGTGGDRSITNHRCAEVLAKSPLALDKTLQRIYCRTPAERATLLHMLENDGAMWARRIVVSDDLLVFERKYTFVEEVALSSNGIIFQLNPRYDNRTIAITVKVLNQAGLEVINFHHSEMNPTPPPPTKRWRIEKSLPKGNYLVKIELERHLAYHAQVSLGDALI